MNEVKRYKLLQSVCYDDGAFVIPAGQVMVTASAHDDVVQALRAENARLRKALQLIVHGTQDEAPPLLAKLDSKGRVVE